MGCPEPWLLPGAGFPVSRIGIAGFRIVDDMLFQLRDLLHPMFILLDGSCCFIKILGHGSGPRCQQLIVRDIMLGQIIQRFRRFFQVMDFQPAFIARPASLQAALDVQKQIDPAILLKRRSPPARALHRLPNALLDGLLRIIGSQSFRTGKPFLPLTGQTKTQDFPGGLDLISFPAHGSKKFLVA